MRITVCIRRLIQYYKYFYTYSVAAGVTMAKVGREIGKVEE